MNDLLLPLLPLVAPVDGSKVHIGGTNHPTHLLMEIKSLVFLSVTSEFTYKICSTYTHPPVRATTTEERTGINPYDTKVSDRSNSPAFSPTPVPIPGVTGAGTVTNLMRAVNVISSSSPGGMTSFSPIQILPGVNTPILNSLNPVLNGIQPIGSTAAAAGAAGGGGGGVGVGVGVGNTIDDNSANKHYNISSPFKSSSLYTTSSSSSLFHHPAMKNNIKGRNAIGDHSIVNNGQNNLILEIEENISDFDKFCFYGKNKKINSDLYGELENYNYTNSVDERDDFICRLVYSIKSSLVGQMMEYFGILSERQLEVYNYNHNKIGIINHKEVSWENLLRSSCPRDGFWAENFRNVPFCIRKKEKNKKTNNTKISALPSRLFSLLGLVENVNNPTNHSNLFVNDLHRSIKSKYLISERNIFTVFIIEALDEVKIK